MTAPRRQTAGLLGSFAHVDALVEAVKAARAEGLEIKDVYSPVPVDEINELVMTKPSPVRFFTFAGGLTGLVGGLALGILTAMIWNITVGGKPVTSHVPFVVIGFEGMILLGALFTFAALLIFGHLPFTRFPGKAYRPEFSNDRFGLWLTCPKHQVNKARGVMEKAGALEVTTLDRVSWRGGPS
jgi:hypothetical protein